MREKKSIELEIKPVALVSISDGTVDTIIECEKIGSVYCKAKMVGFGKIELVIWKIDNEDMAKDLTPKGFKVFQKAICDISMLMIQNYYSAPNDWFVLEHEPEYDVLWNKKSLKNENDFEILKSRFPLFNQAFN